MRQSRSDYLVLLLIYLFNCYCQTNAISLSSQETSGQLDSCPAQGCDPTLTSKVSNLRGTQRNLFKFFTAGITQLIWDDLRNITDIKLTSVCKKSILDTVASIDQGSEWAFRMVDASSKSPSGVLDGTVTSFGDYDECLDIESKGTRPRLFGKHCMANFKFDKKELSNLNISRRVLDRSPVFEHYFLNVGLCLPSTCRTEDIEKIIKHGIRGQPLSLISVVNCDTRASTSFSARMLHLTSAQVIAVGFIAFMVVLVSVATQYHLAEIIVEIVTTKKIGDYIVVPGIVEDSRHFSILHNTLDLFTVKRGQEMLNFADKFKISIILFGVFEHCVACFETPLGLYVAHRLHDVVGRFSNVFLQPLLTLNLLNLVSFMGGCLTYLTTYSAIKSGRFKYKSAIKKKWLRYLPSIFALLALDFVWPLLGDGPMFTQVGNIVLNKCTKNWWMNLLFVSNYKPALDNCIPHTFYSSADLQLYVLGLVAMFLLNKSRPVGVAFSLSMIAFGNYMVYVKASSLKSPVFLDAVPTVVKTISYVDNVHFPTYAHLSDYFVGLLLAFSMKNGFISQTTKNVSFYSVASTVLFGLVMFHTGLHNVMKIIPQSYYGHFLVGSRCLYTIFFTLYAIKNMKLSPLIREGEQDDKKASLDKVSEINEQSRGNVIVGDDMVFSFSKAMGKLTFSIYMINCFYLRYDFFSTRLLYVVDLYNIVKRAMYAIVFSFVLAIYFHIFFVAPFESIRKTFYPNQTDLKKKRT